MMYRCITRHRTALPRFFTITLTICLLSLPAGVGTAHAEVPADSHEPRTLPAGDHLPAEEHRPWQLVPLPLLFYTSDTGVAGGGLLVAIHQDEAGAETFSITTAATLAHAGHAEFSSSLDYHPSRSSWKVEGSLGAFHSPETLYGAVNRDYLLTRLEAGLALLRSVETATLLGPFARIGSYRYHDLEELEGESGTTLQAGGILRYDTRKNPRFPRSGTVMELQPAIGLSRTDTDTLFQQVVVDVRHFVPLPLYSLPYRLPHRDSPIVFAVRSTAAFSTAGTPRHALPSLGGQRLLRGYAADRFTARHAVSLQAELRVPLVDRLGLVAFGAVGAADDALDSLPTSEPRYSGGGGLRFAMNRDRDVNLRLDTGFSSEGMRIYITLMEAF